MTIRNEEYRDGRVVAEVVDIAAGTRHLELDGTLVSGSERALTADDIELLLPVPESVPAWRLMGLLDSLGHTKHIEARVDALTEPSRSMAKRGMQSATIDRDAPLVGVMQRALGLDDEETDELFRVAANTALDLSPAPAQSWWNRLLAFFKIGQ